ncbi:methyltransferase domain-containing protein [Nocardioides dubius]|uniref:27-O-demethylrifamycin SV methyltransferase n=1 Tax=Nocardioides dubius TaxID=317019 RepID=A0ABN1U4P7_9ACTN
MTSSVQGVQPVNNTEPAQHYDRIHEAWELLMGAEFHYGFFADASTPLAAATAALTEEMIRRAGFQAGERVLDVGCGTGRQACDLAERFEVELVGITTSETGVAAGRELAARRHRFDVDFEQRDGTDNGFPDASFDVVWVLESSHLMRDRRALLSECARVLRPGGRLVLCDIIRRREIPFLEVRERRREFGVLRAAFGDAHMEPLTDYAASLTDLGMTVTDATDISAETLGTFAAWRENARIHRDEVIALIGVDSLEEFVEATEILERFWNDRTLGYGIIAATR